MWLGPILQHILIHSLFSSTIFCGGENIGRAKDSETSRVICRKSSAVVVGLAISIRHSIMDRWYSIYTVVKKGLLIPGVRKWPLDKVMINVEGFVNRSIRAGDHSGGCASTSELDGKLLPWLSPFIP